MKEPEPARDHGQVTQLLTKLRLTCSRRPMLCANLLQSAKDDFYLFFKNARILLLSGIQNAAFRGISITHREIFSGLDIQYIGCNTIGVL